MYVCVNVYKQSSSTNTLSTKKKKAQTHWENQMSETESYGLQTMKMEEEVEVVEEEEECVTPRDPASRIPTPEVCPPAPRKKPAQTPTTTRNVVFDSVVGCSNYEDYPHLLPGYEVERVLERMCLKQLKHLRCRP